MALTPPRVVFGVDPGSRWVGWSAIELPAPRHIAAGTIDLAAVGEDHAVDLIEEQVLALEPDLSAVERVSEVYGRAGGFDGRRATDLVRAGWIGGRIADRLCRAGLPPRTFPAEDWRAHFIAPVSPKERAARAAAGERVKLDKVIRALVEQAVAGWPRKMRGLDDKAWGHARDAACVALYGAHLAGAT